MYINYNDKTKLPDKFKIVYFDKEVRYEWHFFDILPQLKFLDRHHHLINPNLYKKEQIDSYNKVLADLKWLKSESSNK